MFFISIWFKKTFFLCFGVLIFRINYCAQTIRLLFLYYNLIFNLHKFTLPLASAANFISVISYLASCFRIFLTLYTKT